MNGIFKPAGAAAAHSAGYRSALIRIEGLGPLLKAVAVRVRGDGGVSAQVVQDFEGTPYFTLFGTRISTFHISCSDIKMVGCSASAARSSDIAGIVAKLKDDARRGVLAPLTVLCDKGPVVSGHLISLEFDIDRPVPSYTLTAVGSLGGF